MFGMGLVAAAAFALSTSGCAAVLSGQHDQTFHFLVVPQGNDTFWGWSEITLGADIDQFGSAELYGVTLQVSTPPTVTDMSFLSSLKAETVTPSARTTVATLNQFPRGEQTVIMHIDYLGDLHPLFETSTKVRIEFTGSINPAFKAWPPNNAGIWVQGDVTINLQ
jgi:hypothetical protein